VGADRLGLEPDTHTDPLPKDGVGKIPVTKKENIFIKTLVRKVIKKS
jgi:hypothetical protein